MDYTALFAEMNISNKKMSVSDAYAMMDKHLDGYVVSGDMSEARQVLGTSHPLFVEKKRSYEPYKEPFAELAGATQETAKKQKMEGETKELPAELKYFKDYPAPTYTYRNTFTRPGFSESAHTGKEWFDAMFETLQKYVEREKRYTEYSENLTYAWNCQKINRAYADNFKQRIRAAAEKVGHGSFDTSLSSAARTEHIYQGFNAFHNVKQEFFTKWGKRTEEQFVQQEAESIVNSFAAEIVSRFNTGYVDKDFVNNAFNGKGYLVGAFGLRGNGGYTPDLYVDEAFESDTVNVDPWNVDLYVVESLEFDSVEKQKENIDYLIMLTQYIATTGKICARFGAALLKAVLFMMNWSWIPMPEGGFKSETTDVAYNVLHVTSPATTKGQRLKAMLKFLLGMFLVSGIWYKSYTYIASWFDPTGNIQSIIANAGTQIDRYEKDIQEDRDSTVKKAKDLIFNNYEGKISTTTRAEVKELNGLIALNTERLLDTAGLSVSTNKTAIFDKIPQNLIHNIITEKIKESDEQIDEGPLRDKAKNLYNEIDVSFTRAVERKNVTEAFGAVRALLVTTGIGKYVPLVDDLLLFPEELKVVAAELTNRTLFLEDCINSFKDIKKNGLDAIAQLNASPNVTPIYNAFFEFCANFNVAKYFTDSKEAFGTYGLGSTFMSVLGLLGLDTFEQIEKMISLLLRDFSRFSKFASFNVKILSFVHLLISLGVGGALRAMNYSYFTLITRGMVLVTGTILESLAALGKMVTRELYVVFTGEGKFFSDAENSDLRTEFWIEASPEAYAAFQHRIGWFFDLIIDSLNIFSSKSRALLRSVDSLSMIVNYVMAVVHIFFMGTGVAVVLGITTAVTIFGIFAIVIYLMHRYKANYFIQHIGNLFIAHPYLSGIAVIFAQFITGALFGHGYRKFLEYYGIPLDKKVDDVLEGEGFIVRMKKLFVLLQKTGVGKMPDFLLLPEKNVEKRTDTV